MWLTSQIYFQQFYHWQVAFIISFRIEFVNNRIGVENITSDGFDIWKPVNKLEEFQRKSFVYNIDMDDQSPNFQFAIRNNQWKFLWGQPEKFIVNKRPKNVLKLYNLADDPFEANDVAAREVKIVGEMKTMVYDLLKEMKPSYQPNRFSLAFPRYNEGIVKSGWCSSDWDLVLWKHDNHWDKILQELLENTANNSDDDYEYYSEYNWIYWCISILTFNSFFLLQPGLK